MRRYFMSVDGGGSKISAVLFDQDFNLLGSGKSGAINPRFISGRKMLDHFSQCIDLCLNDMVPDSIEMLYITMPGPVDAFVRILSQKTNLNQVMRISEGEMWLLAGIFKRMGIVALSGTGSGVFYVNKNQSSHLGGMGALFDDEGSGYAIGQAALSAVVKSVQKRIPHSKLEETVFRHWELDGLGQLLDKVYGSEDYRGVIASLVVTVIETANTGDKAAVDILREAGEDMASQVISLIRRERISSSCPVLVAGSVWKDNIFMFEAFHSELQHAYPEICVCIPAFEAVLGGLIRSTLDKGEVVSQNQLSCIKHVFRDYIYVSGIQAGKEINRIKDIIR